LAFNNALFTFACSRKLSEFPSVNRQSEDIKIFREAKEQNKGLVIFTVSREENELSNFRPSLPSFSSVNFGGALRATGRRSKKLLRKMS